MTPVRDLQAQLRAKRHALAELGPRPPGEGRELEELSRSVRQEAETAATLARRERAIPEPMVFESRGARRLATNVADVTESFAAGSRILDDVADTIARRAGLRHDEQVAYDRRHRELEADIEDLREKIRMRKL
jgi:hypothetical protein